MIKLLAVILLVAHTPTVKAEGIDIVIWRIHAMDWEFVGADDAEAILGRPIELQDLDMPEGSQYRTSDCDGSVYVTSKYGRGQSLTLMFDKFVQPAGPCGTRLHALRFEADGDMNILKELMSSIVTKLGADGPVEHGEYQWKSDDSRVRFVLYTSLETTDKSGQGFLWIRLLHLRASPEQLRDLPFGKTSMPDRRTLSKN